jgi:hypothetical protein
VDVDLPTLEIGALLSPDRWRAGASRRFKQLSYLTREALGSSLTGVQEDPALIAKFLQASRGFIEREASRIAARYSTFRWLWYLRRIPSFIFAGNLRSTAPYDSALAECLSGHSSATSQFRFTEEGSICYRIKSDVIEALIDYCATIKYLSQIHTNLRWAAKGRQSDLMPSTP